MRSSPEREIVLRVSEDGCNPPIHYKFLLYPI